MYTACWFNKYSNDGDHAFTFVTVVASGLESREYGRRNPLRSRRDTLYPQKLVLTSATSGGR
jgi:hypothetical protein